MAFAGPVAGVRSGCGCDAGDGIRQALLGETPPCVRRDEGRSFASERAPLALTQLGQAFLCARIGAYPELAFRRRAAKFSSIRVSTTGRAEDSEASATQDGCP